MKFYVYAAAAFLAAFALGAGYAVYVAYAAFGAILACRYLANRWSRSLSAVRTCRKFTAEVEDTIPIALVIRNAGTMPIVWTLVEDILPPGAFRKHDGRMTVTGTTLRAMSLRAGERKTLSYQVQFHRRGYYRIGPLLQETGDLLGFYRKCRVVTEPHYILVYPKVLTIDGWEVASPRPVGEVRLGCRLFEDPTRIAGVRLYERGDPLNHIHWKATARTGTLHTRLHDPSSVAGATILLDFGKSSYSPKSEPYRSELAITAAASVAHAMYEMGHQVGLLTNGVDAASGVAAADQPGTGEYGSRDAARTGAESADAEAIVRPLVVPADKGAGQFMRIWELLARVELSEGIGLAETVIHYAGNVARDATVFAILAEVTPEIAVALGALRRRGMAVSAVINTYYDEDFEESAKWLLAEHIEVRHLRDEESVVSLCKDVALSHV